ncbi:MAG: hypothetical protein JO295_06015 [Verrucomicrobia bacterium]|nr:hypothetical protein [Verrucomicrobiota bacterium]
MIDPQEETVTPAFNLDELKLMPAWMKEEPAGQAASPSREDRSGPARGEAPREPRRDAGGFRPRPAGGGDRFERRGPRPDRGGNGPRGDRSPRSGGRARDNRRGDDRGFAPRPPAAPPVQPAAVRVDFLPDPRGLASIAKQIRASHLAYPLFGMARMFLSRPERHWVRLSVVPGANGNAPQQLFQLGENGPVALERATLEKIAFDRFRDQYYATETVQKEPPKGNFTNVARERNTGTLLGPTNHHAYQTNLRSLYESRFSRRMSFEQFRNGVEVVSDPALVERWKEETRTTTVFTLRPPPTETETPAPAIPTAAPVATYATTDDPPAAETIAGTPSLQTVAEASASEPPTEMSEASPSTPTRQPTQLVENATPPAPSPTAVIIGSLADARAHFRQHYFDALVRSGTTFELPGETARSLPEPSLLLAIRLAHDSEVKYPGGLVQPLRAGLQNANLQIFKHRKRVVYVSAARPTSFKGGDGAVSENVAAILDFIAQHPLCTRKDLAEKILPRHAATEAPGGVPSSPVVEETDATTEAPVQTSSATAAADENQHVAADAAPLVKAKAALAADLRYLVQAGHVIEFHNGTIDLPLSPKPKETPLAPAAPNAAPARTAASSEASISPALSNTESTSEAAQPPAPTAEVSELSQSASNPEHLDEAPPTNA